MNYKRTHWVYILESVWRLFPLLLFPLVRGFLAALRGGLYAWLAGTWADIGVVLLITAAAILRWHETEYAADERTISLKSGVLVRHRRQIVLDDFCSVTLESPWYLKPVRASHLRLDTQAGGARRSDLTLTLKTEVAQNLLVTLKTRSRDESWQLNRRYAPRLTRVMLIAALLSNSLAGVAFVATFVTGLGEVIGESLGDRFFGTFNRLVRLLSFGIPPLAAAIGWLLIGGWLIGFIQNLLRHQRFALTRDNRTLLVRGGWITPRATLIQVKQLNYITVRQGLLTHLLGLSTVFGHGAGMGKHQNDLTVLTPAGSREELDKNLHLLLPEFSQTENRLRPHGWSLGRYLTEPLIACVAVPFATWLLMATFPAWQGLLLYVGLMGCVPAVWWLFVRLISFYTAGIGVGDDCITLRYSRFLQLRTVVIPRDKIVKISLRQSVWQRLDKKCDILVYSRSESRARHRVRGIYLADARALIQQEVL